MKSRWLPDQLVAELNNRAVNASLIDDVIQIKILSESCDRWQEKNSERLAIRNRALRGFTQPDASIRHDPNRFLRNIEFRHDNFKIPTDEPSLLTAHSSIVEYGAIPLDSMESEMEIARTVCTDTKILNQFQQDLIQFLGEKERLVDRQDFDAAARVRDQEYKVRADFDALLFRLS